MGLMLEKKKGISPFVCGEIKHSDLFAPQNASGLIMQPQRHNQMEQATSSSSTSSSSSSTSTSSEYSSQSNAHPPQPTRNQPPWVVSTRAAPPPPSSGGLAPYVSAHLAGADNRIHTTVEAPTYSGFNSSRGFEAPHFTQAHSRTLMQQTAPAPSVAFASVSPLAADPVHHTAVASASKIKPPAVVFASAGQIPALPSRGIFTDAARKAGANGSIKVSTGNFSSPGDTGVTPKAWVTVPVPDASGGLNFRPRGFSVDETQSSGGSADWEIKNKYLMAVRSGPTECPDHILGKHQDFPKNGEFASPFTLFYYDETAPNNILLDNDVLRADAKRLSHAVMPKNKSPQRKRSDDQSTSYTSSEESSVNRRFPSVESKPAAPRTSSIVSTNSKRIVPAATTAIRSRAPSLSSTAYVSVQPREIAGCCGAKKRVSIDARNLTGSSVATYDVKYEKSGDPEDCIKPVGLGRKESDCHQEVDGSESSMSERYIRYERHRPAEYTTGVGGEGLPPNYPPRGSTISTSTSSYPKGRRTRACCGAIRRVRSTETSSFVTSSSSSSRTSSSSEVSSGTTTTEKGGRFKSYKGVVSRRPTHDRSQTTTTTSLASSSTYRRSTRGPGCGACRRKEARDLPRRSSGDYTTTTTSTASARKIGSKETRESRQSEAQRSNSTDYSSNADEEAPPLRPSLKKEKDRNYDYNLRKMFFDADDIRVPSNGTGLKMLPGYSVSYRNYPVICYDIVAPKRYGDFFRPRKTPGMYA